MRTFLLLSSLALLAGCAVHVPQPNLGLYKKELIEWQESGDYMAAIDRTLRGAERWLQVPEDVKKPALVLDIDETSLSNWPLLKKTQFSITADNFSSWVRRNNDAPIEATRALYRHAVANKIEVYFVTGRREPLREATIRQLKAAGYDTWAGLILRPVDDTNPSVIPFKSSTRAAIESEGRTILLNVGDQYSDLKGGHARKTIKLPNPYYFLP